MTKPNPGTPPKSGKRTIKGQADTSPPWSIPDLDPADVGAIKSLMDGTASDIQQRRVVLWLQKTTGVGEMSFRPGIDGQRATDFAEGKRFVGLQFFTLAKTVLPPSRG